SRPIADLCLCLRGFCAMVRALVRRSLLALAAPLLLAGAAGCASGAPARPPGPTSAAAPPREPSTAERCSAALAALAGHDAAGDWTPEACESTAKQLLSAGEAKPALA